MASRHRAQHPRIGKKQLALLRREGPTVLEWQRRVGLAEARSRCIGLILSGLAPFVGLALWDWSPAAMLLFLAVDVLAVLAGDAIKLLVAGDVLRRSHAADYKAQEVLSIVGGLEDGTGTYTEYGSGRVSAGLLFGIALLCSAFLVPLLVAAMEPLGLGEVRAALDEEGFRWLAGASVALHLASALFSALGARFSAAGRTALFLDSGGILGLYAGMLVLVWLPITLGRNGVIALLAVLFLFRLGFGLFALYWIPRVTRALERHLANPEEKAGKAADGEEAA